MKKLLFISFLILFLFSCQKEIDLNGVWIGTVKRIDKENNSWIYPCKDLIEIDCKNKQIIWNFLNNEIHGGLYSDTSNFKIHDNYFIIEKNDNRDTLVIQAFDCDTLVLRINSFSTQKYSDIVFQKLSESKVPNDFKMQGKAYSLKSNFVEDTIDFYNDSIYLHLGKNQYYLRKAEWKIEKYKNYAFISLDPITHFPIEQVKNGIVYSPIYLYNSNQCILTPISKDTFDISKLYGTWVEEKIEKDSFYIAPLPIKGCLDFIEEMGMDYLDFNEQILTYLIFNKDTLSIKYCNLETKRTWKINSTNQLIIFPEFRNRKICDYFSEWFKCSHVWKIIELNDENLIFERGMNKDYFSDEIEFIKRKYHRVKRNPEKIKSTN